MPHCWLGSAQCWLAPSQLVGQFSLKWPRVWEGCVVSTCMATGRAWLLAMSRSKRGSSSEHRPTEGGQQLQSATFVRTPTTQSTWRGARFHGHFPFDKSEHDRGESAFAPHIWKKWWSSLTAQITSFNVLVDSCIPWLFYMLIFIYADCLIIRCTTKNVFFFYICTGFWILAASLFKL